MNIGIIVLSNTGHTLSVAQRLQETLAAGGHTVCLERVTAMNEDANTPAGRQLKDAPSTERYDVLIFGAPVWAFSLSSVMKTYMSQLPSLQGKRIGCFVTQHLTRAWLGGNQAIRYMKKVCAAKGGTVFETGIINWSGREKENQITELIDRMTHL